MKTEELKELIAIREVLIACCDRHLKELRDPSITSTAMVKQSEVGVYVGDAISRIDALLDAGGVQFASETG